MKTITVLGSTGSIGTQALEVARMHKINIKALAAKSDYRLLEQQAREFNSKYVCIFDEKYYDIPEDKRSYTLVAEDLEKSGIFDNNDSDIVHNPTRKVLTNDELAEIQAKKGKKKSSKKPSSKNNNTKKKNNSKKKK